MKRDKNKNEEKELNEFQLRNIQILTHLLQHNAVSDEIVEFLRQSELDYFSVINKYELLEKKVNIDEKTNLLKFSNNYLTNIIKTASRVFYGIQYIEYNVSFIRFDIDDFSVFNNKYGHDTGDEVLIGIANLIRENSRPTDYVIRFGGEEFDVILPATNLSGSIKYLDNIFRKVRELKIKSNSASVSVTVSAGLSSFKYIFNDDKIMDEKEIKMDFQKMQNQADNALYEAKYLGKNRYCTYDQRKNKEYVKIRKLYVKK